MILTIIRRYKLISTIITCTCISVRATVVIQGNSTDMTQSFSHPINKFAVGIGNRLYVAADTEGAKNYAIACTTMQGTRFIPLTPEELVHKKNKTKKKKNKKTQSESTPKNPLFDCRINHLAVMYGVNTASLNSESFDRIAAVTSKEPSTIHLIDSIGSDKIDILTINGLKDAKGIETTHDILNMTSGNHYCIFAAVTDSKNDMFGKGNSGIAIISRQQEKGDSEHPAIAKLVQIDPNQTTSSSHAVYAAPLNNDSNILHIGNSSIHILDNSVWLDWSNHMQCLYTALHINAQGSDNQGGQAIVVSMWSQDTMKTEDDKTFVRNHFIMKGITTPSAFTPGKNNIVGGIGNNIDVSIHQTKTILTSTVLHYIVIFGGIGKPQETKRNVYALPIIKRADKFNGMLAKKDSLPINFYHKGTPQRIAYRSFVEPALKQGDLFTADDARILVGHGPMTEGNISSILTFNDAVYAIVSEADSGYTPGIFHSQALFDGAGRIKEWTAWRRVSSIVNEYILGAFLFKETGNIAMLTGTTKDNIRTVSRTTWEPQPTSNSKQLIDLFNNVFPHSQGGIQGLIDIPAYTPGLNNINLLIATGLNQIAIAQTARNQNGKIIPLCGRELACNITQHEKGTIDFINNNTNAFVLQGGILEDLHIIKTAAITRVNNAGFIFFGGTHGLAVLLNSQECSFDAGIGLGNNFSGLLAGTTCKKIGAYSCIRKLICDDEYGFLYVVSDKAIDRIDICASNFAEEQIVATTLVHVNSSILSNNDTILDAAISRSLGIIATSNGLFRSNVQSDIRTISRKEDITWQRINLPEGYNVARQIFCVTRTGREQDLTTGSGGNVYILSTNPGKHRASIHRFTITPNMQNSNQEYVIEQLPDFFIKDLPSYFVQLKEDRTWIYTDGSLFFQAKDQNLSDEPLLTLLPDYVRSGLRFIGNNKAIVPINLQNASIMQPIVHSSASGAWFLAQNNILSVNE